MTCNEEIITNFLSYYCEHSEQINVVNSYLSFDYDKLHISGFSLFRTDKIPGFFQIFQVHCHFSWSSRFSGNPELLTCTNFLDSKCNFGMSWYSCNPL